MCRPPSSGRVRRRACGLPAFGRRSRPSVALHICFFDRCATAPETRPLPAVSRAHLPPHDVDRLSSGVRRGEGGDSPASHPGGRWPLHFPGRTPTYPPAAILGTPLPAMLIVRRRRWSSVIGRERRLVRPVTPPSRPRRRSNSDHAGKSTYSGEIDYRFLTFQTGSRF